MTPSPNNNNLIQQTASQYPRIAETLRSIGFRQSPPSAGQGRGGLEFYPPGEEDSFDPSRPAVEVFDPKVQPKDIAGDVVSHHLAQGVDPVLTQAYRGFEQSLTPEQQRRLQEQYQWSQKNAGEKRPFADWYKASGLPAYFRGYLFNQWPSPEKFYTPDQIKTFDAVSKYLSQPAPPPGAPGPAPAPIPAGLQASAPGRYRP